MQMEYLDRLPKTLPRDGRVLVHNSVLHRGRKLGTRGFRAWLQPPDVRCEVCDCGWAPELGPHYRVAAREPVPEQMMAAPATETKAEAAEAEAGLKPIVIWADRQAEKRAKAAAAQRKWRQSKKAAAAPAAAK
jgi:hypothetical protein